MVQVTVRRRIRPLRFAFLVGHHNAPNFRKAVRINTILWGGEYNAIVPIFRRTPRNWETSRKSLEVVQGYLDAFEPDFVITSGDVNASTYGVPTHQVATLDSMFTMHGLGERGISVMDLYRWRYESEFRFVRRDPVALVNATIAERRLSLFAATVFGEFPDAPLDYFARGFRDLGGESVQVTASNYRETLRAASPLAMSSSALEMHGVSGPRRAFFLLNPTSIGDLIDFWNLRALGWSIVALPLEWANELAPSIAEAVQRQHQPDNLLPRSFTAAHLMKGRSVSEQTLFGFAKEIGAAGDTVVVQPWLPRFWHPDARDADRVERIELSAGDDDTQGVLQNDVVSFETVAPEFAKRAWLDRPRVVNTIDLRSYQVPSVARIIPKEIADLDDLLRWVGAPNMIRTSSEGLGILTSGNKQGVTWRVPHGVRVFGEWFKQKGTFAVSGAGKIAQRMIQLLGGPDQVRLIAIVELVKLFGHAAGTASRDIPHGELFALLLRDMQNNKDRVERRIEALLRQKIMSLGLRLSCDQCAQQNWFALDELRERMTCQWCLDVLPFPSVMPPKQPCWSFRPLGPFAARGYAHGAYTVAAAIRTFCNIGSDPRTTWVPSFTLSGTKLNLEADFAVLWQAGHIERHRPQLILGECKTFDTFDDVDVARMKRLAASFPGAILAFATLNKDLTSREKKVVSKLATRGRKGWRNPVMVMTARELTSDWGAPPFCWAHSGVPRERALYDAIIKAPSPHTSLRRLADVTQQLHLDMTQDNGWPHYDAP